MFKLSNKWVIILDCSSVVDSSEKKSFSSVNVGGVSGIATRRVDLGSFQSQYLIREH